MTWTVRTLELPTVEIQHGEHASEDEAWMAYLVAIEAAKAHVEAAEADLCVGVDLQRDDELVEQHWITLSNGIVNSGTHR